jgi:hypothetical protein
MCFLFECGVFLSSWRQRSWQLLRTEKESVDFSHDLIAFKPYICILFFTQCPIYLFRYPNNPPSSAYCDLALEDYIGFFEFFYNILDLV